VSLVVLSQIIHHNSLTAIQSLWNHAKGSPFISTTASLFELMRKALESHQRGLSPKIILVDLSMLEMDHVYYGADIARDLKKNTSLVTGMKYKATMEWLVWAEVNSNSALLASLSFR